MHTDKNIIHLFLQYFYKNFNEKHVKVASSICGDASAPNTYGGVTSDRWYECGSMYEVKG